MEKKETVERFFDDVVKTVKVGFDKVVAKTDQLTHMGRLKMDILSIKRDIEKQYGSLGERVYELVAKQKQTEIEQDEQVKTAVGKIEELEERLALKNDEYEHVARAQKAAAAQQTEDAAEGSESKSELVDEATAVEEAAAGLDGEETADSKK